MVNKFKTGYHSFLEVSLTKLRAFASWTTNKYIGYHKDGVSLADILIAQISLICIVFLLGNTLASLTFPIIAVIPAAITATYIVAFSQVFVELCAERIIDDVIAALEKEEEAKKGLDHN